MPILKLETEEATARLARLIAPRLRPRDTLGLIGGLGAGKSHFCRALISTRLAAIGVSTDIPSPSFSLVQTYDADGAEIWHADLYRLGDISEIGELGLEDAFADAICLVEWAGRLGDALPKRVMLITLEFAGGTNESRLAKIEAKGPDWNWLADVVEAMEDCRV